MGRCPHRPESLVNALCIIGFTPCLIQSYDGLWNFENFTLEDYKAVYAKLASGEIIVKDYMTGSQLQITVDEE